MCTDREKLSLELGRNAPFIAFEDADIDAAVAGAKNEIAKGWGSRSRQTDFKN